MASCRSWTCTAELSQRVQLMMGTVRSLATSSRVSVCTFLSPPGHGATQEVASAVDFGPPPKGKARLSSAAAPGQPLFCGKIELHRGVI